MPRPLKLIISDCEWWSDEIGGGCSASEAFHVSLMCNDVERAKLPHGWQRPARFHA